MNTEKKEWGLTRDKTSGFIYLYMDDEIIRTRKFTNRPMRREILDQWIPEIKRMSKKHSFQISIKLDI